MEGKGEFKELISALKAVVGERYVLYQPEDLAVYECDAETLDMARPDLVVLPGSTEAVAGVMRIASDYGIAVSPRGAGTGLSGGSTTIQGGISLSLTRMNRVISVDPDERTALVECGATNVSVSQAASPFGLYFAPDPSSQIASTIGGNIAENAGGPHCLKYGMTTSHVLGVRAVLYDGTIIDVGGQTRFCADLDLLGLIVGSEGTLAVVTEAVLKLTVAPKAVETMLAYFSTIEGCGQAVSDIVATGVIPAAMEMIDKLTLNAVEDYLHLGLNREAEALLIIELDGARAGIDIQKQLVESCLSRNQVDNVSWAKNESERQDIWRARKRSFGALGRIAPHGYVLDGVIPRSKLAHAITAIGEIARRYDLLIANVYHAGDGNMHPCLLYHRDREDEVKRVVEAAREVLKLCVDLGGTLSGEHGIGVEKILEMPLVFSDKDLEIQERIKAVFDPSFKLNPSKVLPTAKICGESGSRPLIRHKILTDRC